MGDLADRSVHHIIQGRNISFRNSNADLILTLSSSGICHACGSQCGHDLDRLNFRHSLHMTIISRQLLVIIGVDLETAVIGEDCIAVIHHSHEP